MAEFDQITDVDTSGFKTDLSEYVEKYNMALFKCKVPDPENPTYGVGLQRSVGIPEFKKFTDSTKTRGRVNVNFSKYYTEIPSEDFTKHRRKLQEVAPEDVRSPKLTNGIGREEFPQSSRQFGFISPDRLGKVGKHRIGGVTRY